MNTGRLIYDFGVGFQETLMGRIAMAIELAVERHGSDRAVSQAVGVSRNVLARWRAGTIPRPAHRRALAEAAGIPVSWLED